MTGQAIGPVIGGALNSAWGFTSIFWLLFVFSTVVLLALLTFLPETHRSIAGNGSIPLRGFHKPFAYAFRNPATWRQRNVDELQLPTPREPISLKKAFSPLAYILEKDIAVLLAWGAVAYTAWSMVTSSTATALLRGHPFLNNWQIGLCFLPNGIGCVLGSLSTGHLLDKSFKDAETQYRTHYSTPPSEKNVTGRPNFPLVRARLRFMPYFSLILLFSLGLYGPSFEFNDLHRYFGANLVAPLTLQFMIAFAATAIFNINSTMLVDCFPGRPASATALNNLCRCLLGAAGVSAIQPLIGAVRIMKAFLGVTGAVLLFTPLVWVEWKWGEEWKRERDDRIASTKDCG